jgi:hypothetical protein
MVWTQRPDTPAVYFDAAASFPESTEFLEYLALEHLVIRWPTEPILDVFERLGGPTTPNIDRATMEATVYAPVQALLTEKHYDGVFLGLRSSESEGRANSIKYHGRIYRYKRDGVLRCLPLADWEYRDVWCLPFETEITTTQGIFQIGEIVEQERWRSLAVWGSCGWTQIHGVSKQQGEDFIRVKTPGATLVATKKHRVYTTSSGWKEMQDLTPDDTLIILKGTQEFECVYEKPIEINREYRFAPVYDLQTGSGDFFANGVLVHNSYIVSRKLPYNRVYDNMWDMPIPDQRVSYWAGETKTRWGRWVLLKKHYPDLWNMFAERFSEVRAFC